MKKRLNVENLLDFDYAPKSEQRRSAADKAASTKDYSSGDIKRAIRQALKSNTPIPQDFRIDDRDIKQAPNYFDFMTKSRYAGEDKPYAVQMHTAISFFGEYNPLKSDMKWLNNIPVDATLDEYRDHICLLRRGVCPKTGITKSELIKKGHLNPFTSIFACWGQRSGKSATMGMMAAYIVHANLKLQNPSKVYGLMKSGSLLSASFVSLTHGMAHKNLFVPFHATVVDSKFFCEYHELLDYYGKKYGEELYKLNETFIHYKSKNLLCLTGDSLVKTNKGLIELRKLGDKSYKVNGMAHDYNSVINHVKTGKKECLRITTEGGYHLKGSLTHPVLTLNKNLNLEWKEIEDLEVGDYTAINYSKTKFPNNLELSFKKHSPIYLQVLQWIGKSRGLEWTYTTLENTFPDYKYLPALFNMLKKSGMINKTRSSDASSEKFRWNKKFRMRRAIELSGRSTGKHERYAVKIPKLMTPELATVVGYMLSEGWYKKDKYVGFCNTNMDVVNDFVDKFYKVFNVKIPIDSRDRGYSVKGTKLKRIYACRIKYREIIDFMRYIGLKIGHSSKNKTIPWSILQAPKNCVAACLRAMFEGDGCLSGKHNEISYYSLSYRMITQMQALLLNFGILTGRYRTQPDAYNARRAHCIHIIAYHKNIFMKEIGFVTKQDNYNSISVTNNASKWLKIPYTRDYVDYVSKDGVIYSGRKNIDLDKIWFEDKIKSNALLENLMRTHGFEIYKKISALLSLPISWQKIKTIKKIGKKIVYDITVNSHDHAFVANGLVVHNCEPTYPDRRILRGRTRILAILDEADWVFTANNDASKSIKYDVNQVHAALRNSMQTVVRSWKRLVTEDGYNFMVPPMSGSISSPSSKFAFMIPKIEMANKKNSRNIYTSHKATWEVNPQQSYDELYEEIAEEQGEEIFLRDFAAVPPLSALPFIADIKNLKNCIDTGRENAVRIAAFEERISAKTFTVAKLKSGSYDAHVGKILAIDAGEVNNSFSFVIGHNMRTSDGRISPVLDMMGEIMPSKEAPVNFTHVVKNLLLPLALKMSVVMVVADRWQSTKLLSDMEDASDAVSEVYSLKYKDFASFREDVYSGLLRLPKPEMKPKALMMAGEKEYPKDFKGKPVSHFIFQCLTVQDHVGKAVTKGENVTDDLFRAAVLAHSYLVDREYADRFEGVTAIRAETGMIAMQSRHMFMPGNPGLMGSSSSVGSVSLSSAGMSGSTPFSGPLVFARR